MIEGKVGLERWIHESTVDWLVVWSIGWLAEGKLEGGVDQKTTKQQRINCEEKRRTPFDFSCWAWWRLSFGLAWTSLTRACWRISCFCCWGNWPEWRLIVCGGVACGVGSGEGGGGGGGGEGIRIPFLNGHSRRQGRRRRRQTALKQTVHSLTEHALKWQTRTAEPLRSQTQVNMWVHACVWLGPILSFVPVCKCNRKLKNNFTQKNGSQLPVWNRLIGNQQIGPVRLRRMSTVCAPVCVCKRDWERERENKWKTCLSNFFSFSDQQKRWLPTKFVRV